MPRGGGRLSKTVAMSLAREDHTTTPRWRARAKNCVLRRGRPVSRIGKERKIGDVQAEHPPEERLVAPISWATLSVHVVASPGSSGSRTPAWWRASRARACRR